MGSRLVATLLYSTLILTFNGVPIGGGPSVIVSFNETSCGDGGSVCSTDPLLFTCNITGSPGTIATVTLPPSGDAIILNNDNSRQGMIPEGYTLETATVSVNDSLNNFLLILSIESASVLNNSDIICNTGLSDGRFMAGCPVAGDPDPPLDLTHDMSANTVSSAVITWDSPSTTGGDGISITGYRIMSSDNGLNLNVTVDDITYTITGLQYNTNYSVNVTAINSCGLESGPADVVVNIEARVPPEPSLLPPELYCDVPLEGGRPVIIRWMLGDKEDDVVYPGVVNASVHLDPGDVSCSSAGGTNCTVTITSEGVYNVSLTLTNDVGPAQPELDMFDLTELKVKEEDATSVRVTLNSLCRDNTDYTVQVSFGVREEGSNDDCVPEQPVTADIVPGQSVILTVDTTTLILNPGQEYCYTNATLPEISDDSTDESALPTGVIIGIVVAAVTGTAAVIVILVVLYVFCIRPKKTAVHDDQEMKALSSSGGVSPTVKESSAETSSSPPPTEPTNQGPMYQDPGTITRTPHPETGEIYTDVKLEKKKKKKEQKTSEEAGPVYQAPGTIEHQEAPGGDVYAVSQKAKKGKEEKEETAALYSKPDREGQKAKSQGLTYAQLDVSPSSKPPPPSEGSSYANLKSPPSDDA